MTTNDYLAIAILAAFGLAGMFGWFRWIARLTGGVIVGCLALVVITYVGTIPLAGNVGKFLNEGQITPTLTSGVEYVARLAGLEIVDDADQPENHDDIDDDTICHETDL